MGKDIAELIQERHSVRQFKPEPIQDAARREILAYLEKLNEESGLDIRLVESTGKVFGSFLLKFAGWKNPPPAYFAFVAEKNAQNEEKCGYYGEKLVLFVQSLGLNTCWIGLFKKAEANADLQTEAGKTTLITIAVGYGENAGKARKSKTAEQVSAYSGTAPDWFTNGVKLALLAPTAVNRQAFMLRGDGNTVTATCHNGNFSALDLGIVKYHFEEGAGKENFVWG